MKTQDITNFTSVSIRGICNYARARVIWYDGLLRIFTPDGLAQEVASAKPRRKKGHIRTWDVETEKGEIVMRGKCITCGGKKWWRVYNAPTVGLWRSANV